MRSLVLALAVLLVIPLAAADHLIHHRLYVVGRALDASGLPAPGFPVNVTLEGVVAGGPCFSGDDPRTGPRGDINVCRHVHSIPPGAHAIVTVADASVRVPIDPMERGAVAYLQLPGHAPARDLQGDRDFNGSFTVVGGAYNWYDEPVLTEEELSNLTARSGENVTARLVDGETTIAQGSVLADEQGRYKIDLPVGAVPPGARIRVEVADKQLGTEASALFRHAALTIVRDLRTFTPSLTSRPGEETPVPLGWGVALVALVGVASLRRRR